MVPMRVSLQDRSGITMDSVEWTLALVCVAGAAVRLVELIGWVSA